jgi:hypothetical protein
MKRMKKSVLMLAALLCLFAFATKPALAWGDCPCFVGDPGWAETDTFVQCYTCGDENEYIMGNIFYVEVTYQCVSVSNEITTCGFAGCWNTCNMR